MDDESYQTLVELVKSKKNTFFKANQPGIWNRAIDKDEGKWWQYDIVQKV